MHRTSHPLSRACKYLLCEYVPEEPSTLLVDADVDVYAKGRPCGSVAQSAECSHGEREALGSSPGWATIFPPLLHLVAQCGFAARATSIKKCMSRCSSVVPSRFGDKSNSAGGNVRGRPSGSVAQSQDIDVASIEPIQSFSSLYIYYYIIEEEGCQRRRWVGRHGDAFADILCGTYWDTHANIA